MAKPAGPRCNMRCAYCYYLGKEAVLPKGPGRLPVDLLERYIEQRLEASAGPVVHFEWHGGEPTLLGLDYFRSIVRMQRAHLPAGKKVSNGLQTNGTLLDGAWAGFLAAEGFSVGLSLDGPADLHDAFRRTADGGPTHARVERAYALLRERGVFVNVLCVLHARNAAGTGPRLRLFPRAGRRRTFSSFPWLRGDDAVRRLRGRRSRESGRGVPLPRVRPLDPRRRGPRW